MKKFFYLLLVLFLFGSFSTLSQIEEINGGPVNVPTEGIIDGVFIQEHIPTKRMIPYEHVREADVLWSRRVFQYIDLREKINQELYFPLDEINQGIWTKNATRLSLWSIIRQHVMNGDLRVFSPYNTEDPSGAWDGYQLKYPIDPEPGLDYFTDSTFREEMIWYIGKLGEQSDEELRDEYGDIIYYIDIDGVEKPRYPPQDTIWYTSEDIVQYRIKEDWFFDKERSVLDVRIIAIAPVIYKKENEGTSEEQVSGMRELFWLYFPHCRFVFNNYFVYNDKNDAQWMSFDDLFWKRKFNSVIYKQSNTYDRKIESYRAGIEALYESEKIKDEIRNIEHDVWSF